MSKDQANMIQLYFSFSLVRLTTYQFILAQLNQKKHNIQAKG